MILIVGAGGHGRDLAAMCQELGEPYRFVDDAPGAGLPVPDDWNGPWTIGIGEPSVRVEMADRFSGIPAILIDPSARIGPGCEIGHGATIGPNTVLLRECRVGEHAHLCYGINATRATFGDFCTVGPGASFAGYVTVGPRAYVGAGAVVKNKVKIGADAVIGCGAVVVEDVPDGATVKGNPAR